MDRVSKHNYYLDIAQTVAERSTCLRKMYGAIIVKDDVIVSTGYNGSPRGRKNCNDIQYCMRDKLNIPRGERYELCRSVHAEANAIISAPRDRMLGATLYMGNTPSPSGCCRSGITSCAAIPVWAVRHCWHCSRNGLRNGTVFWNCPLKSRSTLCRDSMIIILTD